MMIFIFKVVIVAKKNSFSLKINPKLFFIAETCLISIFSQCLVLSPFRLLSLCTRINQNNKVQAKQWRRRWLWLWRWWLHDDDNIVDVWTMLTLLRCPIVLRSTAGPIPTPHFSFRISRSLFLPLSTLLMRCDKLCHWTALALVFLFVRRFSCSCQARNEKLHCQMPKFPTMMMYAPGHAYE